MVERTDIGPRHFGGKLGYHRAVLLTDPRRWLVVAGHEARDAEGRSPTSETSVDSSA